MDKKIVFFDVDGTIYDPLIDITHKTKKAIKLLKQNGHIAFISTGRPASMVRDDIMSIGFDGLNAACGTYIVCHNKVMLNVEIPEDIMNETMDIIDKYKLHAVFEGREHIYTDVDRSLDAFSYLNIKFHVKDIKKEKVYANKFCLKVDNKESFEAVEPFFEKYYTIISRENDFLELVPKGYSKATGIKYIIDYLKIPWENTYAFGDSENDLDMMKYVCNSVAMGNAVDEIKKICKYTTDSVLEDGVYYGLKRLELI